VVTGIAPAGPLITLTGLRTRRTQQSVVVAKSLQQEANAEPVAVPGQGNASTCARRGTLPAGRTPV
jgi:hypothetical protein